MSAFFVAQCLIFYPRLTTYIVRPTHPLISAALHLARY
jgi:hypothetical protein